MLPRLPNIDLSEPQCMGPLVSNRSRSGMSQRLPSLWAPLSPSLPLPVTGHRRGIAALALCVCTVTQTCVYTYIYMCSCIHV